MRKAIRVPSVVLASLVLAGSLVATASASAQRRQVREDVMDPWQQGRDRRGAHRRHKPPRMAVVVESKGGLVMARRVRALLARDAGLKVQSLDRVAAEEANPDAVVTVLVDRHGDINVLYWDRTGTTESLAAPVPRANATTSIVAASLAAALVRRNLPALEQALRSDPVYPHYGRHGRAKSAVSALSPMQLRAFFASLASVAHRTEGLTEADF